MNNCPICKNSTCQVYDDSRHPSLLICADCRHIYWNSMPEVGELVSFYDSEYTTSHQQRYIQAGNRDYYRSHVEELALLVGKSRSEIYFSDFGCSYPVLLEEAQKLGIGRVLGVDLDEASRAYGLARGISMMTPTEFLSQVPQSTLDVIRFSHVLEHLIDPVETLVSAVEKLAPGGLLYITQPSFPVFRPMKLNYPVKDSVYPNHLHFFSPISLSRMLRFVPVKVFKFFTVENADQTHAACSAMLDLSYSEQQLNIWKDFGELGRGSNSNYPIYCGENSALYAIKVTPEVSKRPMKFFNLRTFPSPSPPGG